MIRWADPFDQYGGDETAMAEGPAGWAQIDGEEWGLSTANPRTGAWALRLTPGLSSHSMVRRVIGDSLAEAKVGYGVFVASLPTQEYPGDAPFQGGRIEILSFRDAANVVQLTFVLGTNGQVVAYLGSHPTITSGWALTTFIERSDPTILVPARAYSHLEFKVKIDATDGYIEVRLNQVTIMNVTGICTQASGNAETSQIAINKEGVNAMSGTFDFDDMVCSDTLGPYETDFVGDQKCFYFPPNSDTAVAAFTPSVGGTSYGVVDEIPPNDADYLGLAATTGKTAVGHAALGGAIASIAAVCALQRSWKTDAGVCDMAPGLLQGATYAAGDGQPQSTGPGYYIETFHVDPVTGVPFTVSDIDTLKQVVERTA